MCNAVRSSIHVRLLALFLLAATLEVAAEPLTIERLVDSPAITGTAPSAVSWSADNRHLAFLWNTAGLPGREIWIVSGDGTQLRSFTTPTTPAQGVSEFAWTPDSSAIVFLRGGEVWRKSVTAGADRLERVATVGRGDAANLAVSPDGTYASFLKDGDLWLLRLATGELTQATRVGVPSIASVPYGEYNRPDVEIGPYIWGGPTYVWSPDSRTIAVHHVDRRGLRKVPFPYYLGKETEANTIRRNYPGDANESRTLGFLDVASGELKLLDLPEPTANRIVDFSWSGDGALLLDRESDTAVDRWVEIVDPRSGKRREVWHDSRDTRIYNSIGAAWHADGKQILMRGDLADRYGLYLLAPGSKQPKLLTDERFDVTDGPYVAGRAIYYQSNEPSPYERHVYRIPAQGGKATRITTLSGDNQPFPSPDGNKVAILHSDDVTPTELYLTDARGTSMRRVTTSPPAEFAARTWVPGRYVTFPSHIDKYTLHARILTPPDLDQNKTYPVIFGPVYSNTVRNRWVSGVYGTLQQLLVQRGYIVVQVDVRGSTGYGRAFREEFLADFAGKDLEDLQSAVNYLKTLPYVDPERLGIWGSSYGGTLTVYSLLKKPGLFKAGVAAAAAVDPHFFGNDDIAIVRRPDSRPDAFERGAAQYAANLRDHLLIIHGMQDNVVPFKTTVALAEELMRQGKDFDFAFAPAAMHRWPNEPHYARYLLGKLVAHFDRYLGPGGQERASAPARRD
jgi:dipeptidyl-peptidase 4